MTFDFYQDLILNMPPETGLLLLVLIIERVIPIPDSYHPITFFRHLFSAIAKKVHPDTSRPIPQQKLAGYLSIPTLLLPALAIIYGIIQFAEYPLLIDAALLWFALSWSSLKMTTKRIVRALHKKQKSLAKDLVQPLVMRDCSQLSELGVCKATIEATFLRSQKQYFTVIFFYLLGGGIIALTYRLLHEMNQAWNTKESGFEYFGQPISSIVKWVEYVPARILAFSFALTGNLGRSVKNLKQAKAGWFNNNTRWLLSTASAAINTQLGGPVMYNNQKHRRARITTGAEATPSLISETTKLIEFNLFFWLLIIMLVNALTIFYHAI